MHCKVLFSSGNKIVHFLHQGSISTFVAGSEENSGLSSTLVDRRSIAEGMSYDLPAKCLAVKEVMKHCPTVDNAVVYLR